MRAKAAGWSYKQKMDQASREAKASLVALAATVVVWLCGGFGLAQFDITVFGTPLWVLGGTIGTALAAIVAAIVLARYVFVDFDFDEDASSDVV